MDGACSPEHIYTLSEIGVKGFVLGTSVLFGKGYDYDIAEVRDFVLKHIKVPEIGNVYQASHEGIEVLEVVKEVSTDIFGGLEVQAGTCIGYNKVLNGVEYHQGSEVFYVKAGQVIELYGTTLHYTPCKVDEYFMTVVLLIKGTNTTLNNPEEFV